jgi:hypothetical protein
MLTVSRLREYLAKTPFQPFRIFLSDGSHHDVPHPEFAWLVGSRLYVAKVVKERGPDDPRVDELAILHIMRFEPLSRQEAKK